MDGQNTTQRIHEIKDARIKNLEAQIESLACNHEGQRLVRYRMASNGVKMYKVQCTRCGELIGDWIPHHKIKDTGKIGMIDDDLPIRYRENCFELKKELNKRKQELGRNDFFEWYGVYLQSPEWHEKRTRVFERCNGICEGCRMAKAVEVHHLTYANVGNEFLFELVGLCKQCHDRYHDRHGEVSV